jgi:hypothetical protein
MNFTLNASSGRKLDFGFTLIELPILAAVVFQTLILRMADVSPPAEPREVKVRVNGEVKTVMAEPAASPISL